MRITIISTLFLVMLAGNSAQAQTGGENYGNTLNLGVGIGYYGYINNFTPVVHANYELNVARNFTLAPFITIFSYKRYNYWGDNNHPYRDYYYKQTVIPVGIKGSYYFDQLLHANSKWDFYLAASLGVAIRMTRWEDGYYGETSFHNSTSGLYLDGHIGAEYHINSNLGLFLDLSSGISTFGLGIHL